MKALKISEAQDIFPTNKVVLLENLVEALTEFKTDYKGTVGYCEAFIGILEAKLGITSYGKTVELKEDEK